MSLPRLRFLPDPSPAWSFGLWLGVAAYLSGLLGWVLIQHFVGDRAWWLYVLSAMSLYLFVPLPFALAAAVYLRSIPLGGASIAGVALFAALWGGLLIPHSRPDANGPILTVMTYNLLGFNREPAGVVEAIRQSGADVVGLQELNPEVAAAIERGLSAEYPYRRLAARPGVYGIGVISRYPFRVLDESLTDPDWIGEPVVLEVDFEGRPFVLVNVHTASGTRQAGERERQARLLSAFAAEQTLPVVITGDFNVTDRNDAYAIMREHLRDAWREAGTGFGHTFPGASKEATPGSSRPDAFGISVPKWLVRIDYVFFSDDWRAIEARIGPWDGHSDHRPVVADLELR